MQVEVNLWGDAAGLDEKGNSLQVHQDVAPEHWGKKEGCGKEGRSVLVREEGEGCVSKEEEGCVGKGGGGEVC